VLNSSPNGRTSYEQHIAVLQDTMSCGSEDKHQNFRYTCCLYQHDFAHSSASKFR